MTQTSSLNRTQDLPPHVLTMIDQMQWDALRGALENGLPANLLSLGDVSLFERVLAELEMSRPLGSTAALEGPTALLDAFIEAGLEQGLLPHSAMTAVGMACVYGQWKWARRLARVGFEVERTSHQKSSTLHALIDGRHQRSVSHLEAGESDAVAIDTAEEFDCARNMVSFLRSVDVDLDVIDTLEDIENSSTTPLGRAICMFDNAVIQGLLLAGANLDAKQTIDEFSGRPLDLAILMGDEEAVKLILGASNQLTPNPYSKDPNTSHPMCLAAKLGHENMIEEIIGAMDPKDLQDTMNLSFHVAISASRLEVLRALYLLGAPVDVALSHDGFSPLHRAAMKGDRDVIDFLIESGAKWEQRCDGGVSAGDMLKQSHPQLARRYAIEDQPQSNVVYLGTRPRRT